MTSLLRIARRFVNASSLWSTILGPHKMSTLNLGSFTRSSLRSLRDSLGTVILISGGEGNGGSSSSIGKEIFFSRSIIIGWLLFIGRSGCLLVIGGTFTIGGGKGFFIGEKLNFALFI